MGPKAPGVARTSRGGGCLEPLLLAAAESRALAPLLLAAAGSRTLNPPLPASLQHSQLTCEAAIAIIDFVIIIVAGGAIIPVSVGCGNGSV